MRDPNATVCVVDDDEAIRDSLAWLFASRQLTVQTYASAEDYLAGQDPSKPGCLVLDIRMAGMSGLELFERLLAEKQPIPVIFLTGHGDVPMAVRALKRGAFDFVEKPFNDNELLDMVQDALETDAKRRQQATAHAGVESKLALLTTREREVLNLVVQGKLNKIIADELGISMKTVEVHRARIMEKTGVHSVAELVQMVLTAGNARV